MRRWPWSEWKIQKQDTESPIVATESVFNKSSIDAYERRDVVTIDIPGVFLHADSDEHIIMVLKGNIALLMCHMDLKLYKKYILFNKGGKPVLYVKILKFLYGILWSALLFYRKLVKDLHKYGIKMNPYDPFLKEELRMENN